MSPAMFSDEERQSLADSARLCEMIVEANPSDTGALETLKEIYTKLGDRERLEEVVARLAGLAGGRPLASGAALSVRPSSPPSAPDPRQVAIWRLGDRLVAEGLITPDQLHRALAAQKGTRDKLGGILVRMGFITEDKLLAFLSQQYNVPSITLTQLDIDPEVLKLVPNQL